MTALKLSAVIITLNEEKNIGRCIDSLLPVIDEFIIVDSFSKDNTAAIIQERGLKIVQREWGGYSETKNFANSLATGDFIFSVDADEALSPQLLEAVNYFKNNPEGDIAAVNRLTNYCGKWIRHSGWYPEYKIRIFKKGSAHWEGEIHENIIINSDKPTITLKGDLLHYSYPTVDSHLSKISKYAWLAAQRDFKSGKHYTLLGNGILKPWFMFIRKYFFQLGMLDGYYGFVIAVISAFERFMRYTHFKDIKNKKETTD